MESLGTEARGGKGGERGKRSERGKRGDIGGEGKREEILEVKERGGILETGGEKEHLY